MLVLGVLYIWLILQWFESCECYIHPNVVGGEKAHIKDFPYSAYIKCKYKEDDPLYASCGSSIINQELLLTAAHCTLTCAYIMANVGHTNKRKGTLRSTLSVANHQEYTEATFSNDISLVRLSDPLKFNSKVSRVVLVRTPFYDEVATIAGWGLYSENPEIKGDYLKSVLQNVWRRSRCLKELSKLPIGVICGTYGNNENYPSHADSGSGLVIRGYLQIGIVAFKYTRRTEIIVYTEVAYFYDWIQETANKLCSSDVGRSG